MQPSNKVTSEVQCTVSAYRVYRWLFICQFCVHIVFLSCCIVYRCVLLFSFTRCRRHFVCQCLLLGRFQCEALFLHFYLRRCPHFVEVLSSCCIKALSLFFILRLRPHIKALASYYIEALSSYFILKLRPCILFEASSSYFILRLHPHILF